MSSADLEQRRAKHKAAAEAELRARFKRAAEAAKLVLKPGDRLRVNRSGGTHVTITFHGWNGNWIRGKTDIEEVSPCGVDLVNGRPVDFGAAVNV
jgi:hypothetical protein